jgi:conjugative transfer signal peptidase TraF
MTSTPARTAIIRAVTVACAAALYHAPRPLLVWNRSSSVPVGLYRVGRGRLERGAIVLARLPAPAARIAARRGYLPQTVPVVKRLGALPGDLVCADAARVRIAGAIVARRARDPRARPMPWWHGCGRLGAGQFMLVGDGSDSFDSRYFGPVGREAIIGKASRL